MCGRFTLRTPPAVLLEHFRLNSIPGHGARLNICPTEKIAVIRQREPQQREFVWMQWGLIPRWAKDPKSSRPLINARAESAASKPAFRDSFRRRRCLIPADGFYEWQKIGSRKQPHLFRRKDGEPFAFAGLWERWGSDQDRLESCTILTTSANELVGALHDRMPVILGPADYDRWLDPSVVDATELEPLLDAFPADEMVDEEIEGRLVPDADSIASPADSLPENRPRQKRLI
jgi:putative SOS response-associated peptidase YedK